MSDKISDVIAAYDAEHPPADLYDRRRREVAEQREAEERAQKAREAKQQAVQRLQPQ